MGALKCKMCGSNLEIEDSITVCKCEKCGTSQTVPDIEDDKELKLFERAGRLRFNCDFDKAAGIYNTITDSYPEEAEGYWGLILCKYGIEYADNASGKKVPVCHRISYDSVMDDEDFELVMENSDSESRAIFREEAKIIEENRKKYIQIAESEQPYDIYISYRAKDDNGDKTAVSEIAGHLYNKLTSAGYRVFLSEAALKGKKRSECEPYIYSALNSANVMLALGTSYDDYNDVWVKNEWNRYLEIAEKNKNKCLIPCYKDVDEYDIPKEFAGLKVCQLGNDDTFNNIMAEIANVVKPESVNQSAPQTEPAEEIELEEIEIIEPVNIDWIDLPYVGIIEFPLFISIPLTIFWIIGFINTVNLIDGLDGLAAGIATIASIAIALLAFQMGQWVSAAAMVAMTGACLGFLQYNFNPAKIFMGDTGSMFLGYVIAAVSVMGSMKTAAAAVLIVPLVALAVPITDTVLAIVRRRQSGVPIFSPDKNHLHHRLLAAGLSQKQVVLVMYALTAFFSAAALLVVRLNPFLGVAVILFALGVFIFLAKKLGVMREVVLPPTEKDEK